MKYLINAFVAIITIILLIGLFEGFLHISGWQPEMAFYPKGMFEADSSKGYRLSPKYKGKMERAEYSVTIEINSIGIRDKELNTLKKDAKKIFVVGDSFVNGYFVQQENTLSHQLEEHLRREYHQNVACLNLGVSGYGPWQEILLLKQIAEIIRPDVILFCLSQNDLSDELRFVDYTVVGGYRISKKQMPFLPLRLKALLLNFKITYYLGERFYKLKGRVGAIDEENLRFSENIIYEKTESAQIQEGLKKIHESLVNLKNYCTSNSIKLAATYLPSKNEIYKGDWIAFTQTYHLDPQKYNMDLAEHRCRKLLERNGIVYLPVKQHLSTVSRNSPERLYFRNDNHWNKYGIREAANSLTFQLVEFLR